MEKALKITYAEPKSEQKFIIRKIHLIRIIHTSLCFVLDMCQNEKGDNTIKSYIVWLSLI